MISVAVVAILKATLVCGVPLLLARVCRRARASIRHLVLALAFAALIAIPAAGPMVPAVTVMLPAAAAPTADARPGAEAAMPVPPSTDPRPFGESSPAIVESAAAERSLTIPQVLVALWLIGVAIFLLPVVAGFWQVRRLRRTAIPWAGGEELLRSLASARGVHRRIDTVLHDAVAGPMTCGMLRPAIIMPVTAEDWDEASLRRSLRHELEHVARWDLFTNCFSRMICAAYWFHPLVWAAWRRLRLEAERACDDAVVVEDDA
jgi:beta-lactamase regulating signal transducer with metallopeptidase domain